jgi:hypothetical protein
MCVNCERARRQWADGEITVWELERKLDRCLNRKAEYNDVFGRRKNKKD